MKKVEQVKPGGGTALDYDQPLKPQEISELFYDLFGNNSVMRGKQHILYESIGVLTANITYLGHPWPIYKKRMQLKSYFPEYYQENLLNGIKTLLVGIYHYRTQILFVVFDAEPYMARKSHNSSAHVQTFDLEYAAMTGSYSKIDANGNAVRVMDAPTFVEYIQQMLQPVETVSDFDALRKEIDDYIQSFFETIPTETWIGMDCFKEMKSRNAPNWRQGEWQGWYFEYLFQQFNLNHPNSGIRYHGDKKASGIDFDIVFSEDNWIYGDLKADKEGGEILGNKFGSFDIVLEDHDGLVLYIVLQYKAEMDKRHGYATTIFWNQFREDDRQYLSMDELISGYGVRMKYSVTPTSVRVISIDKTAYEILKRDPFYQGRNSSGGEREPKLKINKDMIEALSIYQRVFAE